ncbi:tetratricopeptide repeat protein [Candidatus Latescibacterota bacterium]
MVRTFGGALFIGILALGVVLGGQLRNVTRAAVSPEVLRTEDVVFSENVPSVSTADPELQQMIRTLLTSERDAGQLDEVTIDYPLNGSVFPPEFIPPTFLWHDANATADTWLVDVAFGDSPSHLSIVTPGTPAQPPDIDPTCISSNNELPEPTPYEASAVNWCPSSAVWQAIKENTVEHEATITVCGFSRDDPSQVLSRGRMRMKTSDDPVGAPIFYRDVPLMPGSGKDGLIQPLETTGYPLIAWRLRDVSRTESRLLMTDLPTCANCHSFSLDGATLGMDIDGPAGDKGAYAVAPITEHMVIERENVISWNYTFKDKPPDAKTIGFASQVSPDGRYVVSTVNEEIYVQNFLDYRFLQVFYVMRGILAYYSRATGEIKALPGADDTAYVHCDPVWSPDGSFIVFARAPSKDAYPDNYTPATYANDPNEIPIQYDLYRIPFNDGKGGEPVPVRGASNNGMSNNFPKVSPDGRYIVFVKCRNGQLMRPDSKLWIVPAEGGEARLMKCNTPLMNSWHSFSPNGRWLVFSSKANTPYTQMFLTHIDEDGSDTPAILIPHSTAANRAVNIPEFVNIAYDDLVSIEVPEVEFRRYMANGFTLFREGLYREAVVEWERTLAENPDDIVDLVDLHNELGTVYGALGDFDRAVEHFREALAINPQNGQAQEKLALVQWMAEDPTLREGDDPVSRATRACELTFYRDPLPLDLLAQAQAGVGNFDKAIRLSELALWLVDEQHRSDLTEGLEGRLELYRQGKPYRRE